MSAEPEVVDAEPVLEPEPSREIVTVAPALAVTPQVQAAELIARLDVIREAQQKAMQEGVDYGVIPGTDKPTLYKPGAEKLNVLFQLDVQLVNEKDWGPGEHLTVISHATVYHAPTGSRLGYGEGICTTRERKYAKRKQERACPTCGAAAVIKGKAEYGGGWVCWKKRNGCDAKFPDGDPLIEGQEVGEIENPDLPDLWNTVVKMAEKRARVDAVLAVTGASALFTQDVEDQVPSAEGSPAAPSSPPPASAARPASEKQISYAKSLLKGKTVAEIRAYLRAVGADATGDVSATVAGLSGADASALIERLKVGPHPDAAHPSDVPADVPADVPWSPEYEGPEGGS